MDFTNHYVYVEAGAVLPKEQYPKSKFGFRRKQYFHPNDLLGFQQQFNNTDIFRTELMYIDPLWYRDTYGRWILNAEESLKFGDFYLDLDYPLETDADYEKIKEDALVVIKFLTLIMKIPNENIKIFYSGSKGVHITVPAVVFGLEPHLKINEIYKELMQDILRFIKHDTVDVKIYDNKRLFRIPNSFNSKGQRFKIPLTLKEFKEWDYKKVREIALQPRFIEYPVAIKVAQAEQVLHGKIELWSKRAEVQVKYDGKMKEIKELPPCIKEMHSKTFRETIDERNNSATALASFYMQKGLEVTEVRQIMWKWNGEQCKPPLKTQEIKIITDSVFNGRHRYGCETLKRVSGVCDKENCPLFKKTNEAEKLNKL